jgi:hypothetical protein
MTGLFKRKNKEQSEITYDDFELIDEFGLDVLVNLIGADIEDQTHLSMLNSSWEAYLKKVPELLGHHIKRQPYYSDFTDEVFKEGNKGKLLPFTEEDIIREHVEPKSELYQKYYDNAHPTLLVAYIPGGIDSAYKEASRKIAIRSLLSTLNQDRAKLRPEDSDLSNYNEYKKAQKMAKNFFPEEWDSLYETHVESHAPTVEEYSLASLINKLGLLIVDYDSIDLGESPSHIGEYDRKRKGSYVYAVQGRIKSRFNAMLEYEDLTITYDGPILDKMSENLGWSAQLIQKKRYEDSMKMLDDRVKKMNKKGR